MLDFSDGFHMLPEFVSENLRSRGQNFVRSFHLLGPKPFDGGPLSNESAYS